MTQELDSAAGSDTISSERSSKCALRVGFLPRIASSLLLYPGYRKLWISNLFFFGGLWTQTLVLGWLVFETTRSEFSVALFTAARLGPMMLGPLAGVISDRFDRPKLLLAASGWAFAVLSVIALLVALDKISFWGLVFGGFCLGLAQSPSQPARFALVADLVDREKLSNANALNSLVLSLTQMVGPALGGTMIVAFGAASALAISAGWYLVSFVALWPMRNLTSARRPDPEEGFASLVAAGFRTISGNVLLRSVLCVTFLANILLWPIYQGFMPVIAKEHLGLTPQGLGLLLACAGTGSLAGALVIASLGDFRYKGGLFLIGTAIWGVLWATFALSSSMPLSLVLMGLIGLSASPFGILQTTLMLMMTEPHVQGRVMGIQELTIGVMPVSSLLLGSAAEVIGIANVALISGTLLAISLTVLALRVPELLRYSGHNN